jgi:hypothetical protein
MHCLSPTLSYESEIWTLVKKDKKRLTPTEMKFFRTAGTPLFDNRRYGEILEEMKVEPV